MAPSTGGLGFPERMANILPSLVLMYVPAVQMTEYEVNKPYQHPVNNKHSTVFWNWGTFGSSDNVNTLSYTDPGLDIRAAVGTRDHNICRAKILNHEETNWEHEARSCKHYKWTVCTSGGDNALHINAGLLQVVDRESRTWTGDTNGYLSRHHGNGCGLNWPHACNWFLF